MKQTESQIQSIPFISGELVRVTARHRRPATREVYVEQYTAVITGIEEREPGFFYASYRPVDHPNWFGFGCTWVNANGLGVSMRNKHDIVGFGVVAMERTGRMYTTAPARHWTPTPGDPAYDSMH